MKKILLLALLFCSLTMQGQSRIEAIVALKAEMEKTNEFLPMTISFCTMQKMEIKGNTYIVNYVIDESQMEFNQYVSNMSQNKSNICTLVSGENKSFANVLVKSGVDLHFVITGKQSNRKKTIVLTAAEIKSSQNSDYNAREFLMEIVKDMNEDLPEDWGNGLYLTAAYVEGNYLCYKVRTNDTYLTIPLLKSLQDDGENLGEYFIEGYNELEDPLEIQFVKYLKKSGLGMKFIFWSKNHTGSVTAIISPSEIKNKIRNY